MPVNLVTHGTLQRMPLSHQINGLGMSMWCISIFSHTLKCDKDKLLKPVWWHMMPISVNSAVKLCCAEFTPQISAVNSVSKTAMTSHGYDANMTKDQSFKKQNFL